MIKGTLRTVKYVFALTNLVLVCFALGLIALATNWRTELFPIKEIEKLGITQGAAIALIIIGSVLFILSFLGSAGSLAENQCMLVSIIEPSEQHGLTAFNYPLDELCCHRILHVSH